MSDGNGAVRVMLADDHTMLREGLSRSLAVAGFEIVGEAADGDEAVTLARELAPDVVLMDVTMPVMDGLEATRVIRAEMPDVQVVMLTMHADADLIRRAITVGASGYLTKDCSTEEIVRTVRLAAAGETVLSQEMATSMLEQVTDVGRQSAGDGGRGAADGLITKREEEVLQLVAEGKSTTEVAEELFISVKTVKNHLASIYEKLDSRDRTQAVVQAVRMGIIKIQ